MIELPCAPFLVSEIHRLGLSRQRLRDLLDDRVLVRVFTGVYVRADIEDTIELRAACAKLVLPDHCVVADRSAAWLHGIDCLELAELALPTDLEVVSLRGHTPTRREGILGGERALRREDVCEVDGVRVTTPARTACDVACLLGTNRALAVLDAFRRVHRVTLTELYELLPRYTGRRGVKQLRRLIPLSSPLPESAPESWTRGAVVDEGFPAPEPQLDIFVPDYGWVRADMGYRNLKICIEYDGEEFHSEDHDREHDERRREAMRREGWIVIVIRKDGFSGPARERWVSELKAALDERSPRPGKRIYSRGEDNPAYRTPHRRG